MRRTSILLAEMKDTFLYFAYGSNLLTERIRINNPSAVQRAVANLKGYNLSFTMFVERWQGAVATISATPKENVWGVVWELDRRDLENLDRQEFGYVPITVNVETTGGLTYQCRTYQLEKQLDGDDRPSHVYKNVIIKGAIENKLPNDYIERLMKIKDNGYNGPVEVKLSFRG